MGNIKRKLSRFAIPNLIYFLIGAQIVGFCIDQINPLFYYEYLSFDVDMILHGQLWRLITFIFCSRTESLLFLMLGLYIDYLFGRTLTALWGEAKFTRYILCGILFTIIGGFVCYGIFWLGLGVGISLPITMEYVCMSMLLAYGVMFPHERIYFMMLIPIKARMLVIFYIAAAALEIVNGFRNGWMIGMCKVVLYISGFANFIIFYFSIHRELSLGALGRKIRFNKSIRDARRSFYTVEPGTSRQVTKHKCAICGRTEQDGDDIFFRYCTKCKGNYEYCQDHLFTHNHIV